MQWIFSRVNAIRTNLILIFIFPVLHILCILLRWFWTSSGMLFIRHPTLSVSDSSHFAAPLNPTITWHALRKKRLLFLQLLVNCLLECIHTMNFIEFSEFTESETSSIHSDREIPIRIDKNRVLLDDMSNKRSHSWMLMITSLNSDSEFIVRNYHHDQSNYGGQLTAIQQIKSKQNGHQFRWEISR